MLENPFGDEVVEEVPLPHAPLIHTVAQLRFSRMLSLNSEAGIAPLQQALEASYPVLTQDSTVGIMLLPDGVASQPQGETVWRFESSDGTWRVSVSAGFISIDTSAYESRSHFLERLRSVLDAFGSVVRPARVERVGIRYIDRVDDPEQFARINTYVRPELLGALAVPLGGPVGLHHSLSEAVFVDGEAAVQLLARWGVVGPQMTLDPMLPVSANPSWLLDIDVSQTAPVEYDPAALTEMVGSFAERVYRFFRWAVTDDLLRDAGGEL